jgi:hypothetical protein
MKIPKWGRKKRRTRSELVICSGPDTDVDAMNRDLREEIDRQIKRKATSEQMDAAMREVAARHGGYVQRKIQTSDLPQPWRTIVEYGAAMGQAIAGTEAGSGRHFISDGRWMLYASPRIHAAAVSAGVPDIGEQDSRVRVAGGSAPLEVRPSPRAMLREFGIGTRNSGTVAGDGRTCLTTFEIAGVEFAADAIAVLALAGATRVAVDPHTMMVEGRDEDGEIIGYCCGIARDRVVH